MLLAQLQDCYDAQPRMHGWRATFAWENAMKNHSSILLVTSIMVTMLSVGCNTPIIRGGHQQRCVTITTEPPGATVSQIYPLDESETILGTTPLNEINVMIISYTDFGKNVPASKANRFLSHVNNLVVRIEKQGYESCQQVLRTDRDKTIEHNIVLQSMTNP